MQHAVHVALEAPGGNLESLGARVNTVNPADPRSDPRRPPPAPTADVEADGAGWQIVQGKIQKYSSKSRSNSSAATADWPYVAHSRPNPSTVRRSRSARIRPVLEL